MDISFFIDKSWLERVAKFIDEHMMIFLVVALSLVSGLAFAIFYFDKLGLAYNDARSHLDIGRRVVEGLKPGLAQLGSVWLPLPHLLMVPTIWNDFMWHTGLSGALESMVSYVATGVLIYAFLKRLGVGVLARTVGVLVFALNYNILYLQSTAMTELLLIATMTASMFELLEWEKGDNLLSLIKSSFWLMLSTLIRYDGWFLLGYAAVVVAVLTFKRKGYKASEGAFLFFCTLSAFGIALWFLWNQVIFHDALYFVLGPYSAHAQQQQLSQAGVLATKGNLPFSVQVYLHALTYNSGLVTLLLGVVGAVVFAFDKKIRLGTKIVMSALLVPLIFNIIALYFGFSVLFVQGLSGNTWFNVRYGVMMMPSIAISVGYLLHRVKRFEYIFIILLVLVTAFAFISNDAVTIDDARVGSSQKNVSEVAGWLHANAMEKPGFVLISAASHDAIIFSSGLPMTKFIHEGTGKYWLSATASPDRWARWIIMRTNDLNDQTFKLVKQSGQLEKYTLVHHFPFADIYEIKPQYVSQLHVTPVFGKQK